MKFRSFIWISGIALLILGLVQYYYISETFKTKQEQFDSKYSGLAKLGLFEFENRFFDSQEDSIFSVLDDYAYFAIHDAGLSNNAARNDTINNQVINEFNYQLNQRISRDHFLRSYFISSGDDSVFVTKGVLRELALLSYGEEKEVFRDTLLANELPLSNGYLINSYIIERNYFRMKYDYYISFPQRAEQISKEMILSITLSFFTMIIVFGVFFMTLRNLLIQKRLSDLKTDFINNMTHELKTPLSTISVASSSLAANQGKLSRDRIVEISEIIKKQNKHLSRLIDRILDITIWEKDQIRVERQAILIEPFFEEIIGDFEQTHAGVLFNTGIQLVGDEQKFLIDEVHMTTVVNNLLSNAMKYGGDPAEIGISVICNHQLSIKVKDNGPGIPLEEQKHIFEKFFRGKDSKKKAIRGLGLGLYYVKQIVEAHRGEIRLESSTDKGSTFIIEIPE
jgi:signal transduction histidine kinase